MEPNLNPAQRADVCTPRQPGAGRIGGAAINTALVLALVLLLGTSHLLDKQDGISEWDSAAAQVADLDAARAAAQTETRKETAAAAACNQQRGPNSAHGWTPDGELTCTTRRGVVKAAL